MRVYCGARGLLEGGRGHAVLLSIRSCAAARSSGVLTATVGHALQAALGEADEGAGRGELDDAGDAGRREGLPCRGPSAPGEATWPTSRSTNARAAVDRGAVAVGPDRQRRVVRRRASAATARSVSTAGCHVAGVEGAGDLQRDDAGAGRRVLLRAAARAASAPATTIWPPPLKLAGSRPSSARRASSSASSPPMHGAHAGRRSSAAASAIARPRSRRGASRPSRSGCRRRPPR